MYASGERSKALEAWQFEVTHSLREQILEIILVCVTVQPLSD